MLDIKTINDLKNTGFLSKTNKDFKINYKIYTMWRKMHYRCYDPSCKAYQWYGAKGCIVCDRWHYLSHFVEDIKTLQGYDEFISNPVSYKWVIDKDSLQEGCKVYSPSTCIILDRSSNTKEMIQRVGHNMHDKTVVELAHIKTSKPFLIQNIYTGEIYYCKSRAMSLSILGLHSTSPLVSKLKINNGLILYHGFIIKEVV